MSLFYKIASSVFFFIPLILTISSCRHDEGEIAQKQDCKKVSEIALYQDGIEIQEHWSYDRLGRECGYEKIANGLLYRKHSDYRYDDLGHVTYLEEYNEIGELRAIRTFSYIGDKLDFQTLILQKENGTYIERWNYDSHGRETLYERSLNGEVYYRNSQYGYSSNKLSYYSNFQTNKDFNYDLVELYKDSMSYDQRGNLVFEKISYINKDYGNYYNEWSYNRQNQLTHMISRSDRSLVSERMNYQYDHNDNLIYYEEYYYGGKYNKFYLTYECQD